MNSAQEAMSKTKMIRRNEQFALAAWTFGSQVTSLRLFPLLEPGAGPSDPESLHAFCGGISGRVRGLASLAARRGFREAKDCISCEPFFACGFLPSETKVVNA